jgi:hypothetical protein
MSVKKTKSSSQKEGVKSVPERLTLRLSNGYKVYIQRSEWERLFLKKQGS